jgi:epoxyqueuosine reductase
MSAHGRRELTERIKSRALALGFSGVGVAAAGPAASHGFYRDWLAAGHGGAMAYLERHASTKAHPERFLAGARSLVVVALPYGGPAQARPAGLRGRVAQYALGRDYHEVIGERLARLAAAIAEEAGGEFRFRVFVDTAPVMEREWAARAGLGWVGKNGNLIHWQHGSFLFLGGIAVTLDLEPDAPDPAAERMPGSTLERLLAQDGCGECRACLDACPTGAIVADRTVDARRCISYLTIELKGPIPAELRPQLGEWVYGCDVCQDVCPWNRTAPATQEPEFRGAAASAWPDLVELLALDEAGFRARFGQSAVRRTRRRGLARNAALALGNLLSGGGADGMPPQDRSAALAALVRALADPEPVVRGAAAWALGQARSRPMHAALGAALERETDAQAREELQAALASCAGGRPAGDTFDV